MILGAGRRGLGLARHLIDEQKDVVLLDNDPERIEMAISRLDCLGIVGNGTDRELLAQAGCAEATAFIAVTDSDEINLISCGLVSTNFPTVKTVAAIRSLLYTGPEGLKEPLLGIDHIVNPNAETAQYIYNIIDQGIYSDVISFSNTKLQLYNFYISDTSPYAGCSIMDLRAKAHSEFVVAAISHKGRTEVPSGTNVIQPKDILSIVTDTQEIPDILKSVGEIRQKANKIVLMGASKIARALLNRMPSAMRSRVTVIDHDQAVCDEFSERFTEILVIKADITDEDILQEEHLDTFDLLIALTDNDELNIITATFAKRIGIARSMALIRQNNNYIWLAEYLEIDVVVSTTDTTVDSLLRYLRGTNVASLHSLFNGQLEVYEFSIDGNSSARGKRLSDLNMRQKGIIAGLTDKHGKIHVPSGNSVLQEGDSVLVAVNHKSSAFIQKLFA